MRFVARRAIASGCDKKGYLQVSTSLLFSIPSPASLPSSIPWTLFRREKGLVWARASVTLCGKSYTDALTSLNKPFDLLSLESPLGSDYWYAVYLVVQRILEKLGYSGDTAAELFAKSLALSKSKEDIMNVTQAIKQEGIEQGMQQEKLGIAQGMLEDKLPKEQVSKWTGLSLSQVDKLLEEIS